MDTLIEALREMRAPQTESERMPGRRVLVVEDDITFEPIWGHIIHQADKKASMDWATSAQEATQMIEQASMEKRPFDLIISDIFLSGPRTGVDLWVQFHKKVRERFVLISAADQMKIMKHFRGPDEPVYMHKPLIVPEAISTIYALLKRAS